MSAEHDQPTRDLIAAILAERDAYIVRDGGDPKRLFPMEQRTKTRLAEFFPNIPSATYAPTFNRLARQQFKAESGSGSEAEQPAT